MRYALNSEQKRRLRGRIERNKHKLTKEQRVKLVREAVSEDVTQEQLAERYGVSRTTVAYHIKRAVAA